MEKRKEEQRSDDEDLEMDENEKLEKILEKLEEMEERRMYKHNGRKLDKVNTFSCFKP